MPTKEYLVDIKEICGKNRVTRDDGKKIHDIIREQWHSNEKIKIDFGDLLVASVSFTDEAFGKLAFEFSKEEIVSKLKFENMQEFDKALLNDILSSRFRQKEIA